MRWLLAALVLAWSAPALASELVKTAAFQLTLPGDWRRAPTSEPDQQVFESKGQDVHLTTSFLLVKDRAPPTLELARKYEAVRLEAERQLASEAQLRLTLGPATITPIAGGHRIDFAGHDQERRRFRFRALVLPGKVISMYLESYSRTEAELLGVVEQLTQELRY